MSVELNELGTLMWVGNDRGYIEVTSNDMIAGNGRAELKECIVIRKCRHTLNDNPAVYLLSNLAAMKYQIHKVDKS